MFSTSHNLSVLCWGYNKAPITAIAIPIAARVIPALCGAAAPVKVAIAGPVVTPDGFTTPVPDGTPETLDAPVLDG